MKRIRSVAVCAAGTLAVLPLTVGIRSAKADTPPGTPTSYTLSAGAQGMGGAATFTGSSVNPLLNGASTYALSTLNPSEGGKGLATVAYPGTLGLIAQNALPVVAPNVSNLTPPVVPAYPVVAQADSVQRNSEVGVPRTENGDGSFYFGGGRQACNVANDDTAVTCVAEASDVRVPTGGIVAVSGQPAVLDSTAVSALRSARLRLLQTLATLDPAYGFAAYQSSASADSSPEVMSAAGMKTTTSNVIDPQNATSTAETTISNVSILGGLIKIGSVHQLLTAVSDGVKGKSTGTTTFTDVSIAGVPVKVGPDGVVIAGAEGASADSIKQGSEQLAAALSNAGVTFRAGVPAVGDKGPVASLKTDGGYLAFNVGIGQTRYIVRLYMASGTVTAFRSAPENSAASSAFPSSVSGASGSAAGADSAGLDLAGLPSTSAGDIPAFARTAAETTASDDAGVSLPLRLLGFSQDLSRDSLVAMLVMVEFLGLAAVAAAGWRLTANRADLS